MATNSFPYLHMISHLFFSGVDPDLNEMEDPHACAALLKLYLRELPDPLLTFELYDCFLAASCKISKNQQN